MFEPPRMNPPGTLASGVVPGEAPLAHVPGSIFFWFAFMALGVFAFGAGLWGLVWRRMRQRRLRADMAQWPVAAPVSAQATFALELVRRLKLRAPAQWMESLDRLQNSALGAAEAEAELQALRAAIAEMEYVD